MAASVRLKTSEFRKFSALRGWNTDTEKAGKIGVDPSSLSRVLGGDQVPGAKFIAGALRAFDGLLTFEDLFEVVGDVEDERIPA